jgi:uncharacterized protein
MSTDPFDALRGPDVPVAPDPDFRDALRRRVVDALEDTVHPSWLYYFTIPARDLDHSRRFFTSLFPSWEVSDNEHGTGFHVENVQPPMGVSTNESEHPKLWFVTTDIGATIAKVRSLGGTATEPVNYESGAASDCTDDQGVHFSLSVPTYESHPVASTQAGELFYFNLPAADTERAKRFYGELFGWEFGDYTGNTIVNSAPEGGLGGFQPGEHPEVWFRVDDLDGAMRSVEQLGGTAMFVGEGEEGRHAWCTDGQGVGFGISEPAARN